MIHMSIRYNIDNMISPFGIPSKCENVKTGDFQNGELPPPRHAMTRTNGQTKDKPHWRTNYDM